MQHEVGDLCAWVWVILDQWTELHGEQVWKKVGGSLDAIFTLFFMTLKDRTSVIVIVRLRRL